MNKRLKYLECGFKVAPENYTKYISVSHICALFEYCLPKILTETTEKIVIEIVDQAEMHCAMEHLLDVLVLRWNFNSDKFNGCSEFEKRCLWLDVVCEALRYASNIENWSCPDLEETKRKLIDSRFEFSGTIGRRVKNSITGGVAACEFVLTPEYMDYYVSGNAYGDAFKLKILSEAPQPWNIKKNIESIQWISESLIRVNKKGKPDYWHCNILTQVVDFFLDRAARGDGHGYFILGKMYYEGSGVLKNREKAIEALVKSAKLGYTHAISFMTSNQLW